jgi:acyl-CoA thioester hydrolase
MEKFRFSLSIPVRFRDLDLFGHVNNAVYATYFEVARMEYCRQALGPLTREEVGFVVAHLEIDYLMPVSEEDEVRVGLAVTGLGRSSFVMEYLLTKNGAVAAKGNSVQVFYDHAAGGKRPLPASFRQKVERFERGGQRC